MQRITPPEGRPKCRRVRMRVLLPCATVCCAAIAAEVAVRWSSQKTSLGVPYETRVLTQVVSDAIPYDTQAPGFALIIR